MTITRVVVNLVRHETCVYEFDGVVRSDDVEELIDTGEYQPVDSKIHSEDIDVIDLRVMSS